MNTLSKSILDFVALVDAYVAKGTLYERAEAARLHEAAPGFNAEFKAARVAVLEAGPPLAVALEQAGIDSRGVLRVCNAVGGPGGPACIGDLWPTVKADLQRATIVEPQAGDGGPWSKPDTPQRWANRFGVSVDTIKRRFKNGEIPNRKLSDRSYMVRLDCLPAEK